MSDETPEHRTIYGLAVGSKVCVLLALGMLLVAAYFYFEPLTLASSNGPFRCASAANPPGDAFSQNVCSAVTDRYQLRALLATVAAVVTAVLGTAMFGITRRERTPRADASLDE